MMDKTRAQALAKSIRSEYSNRYAVPVYFGDGTRATYQFSSKIAAQAFVKEVSPSAGAILEWNGEHYQNCM